MSEVERLQKLVNGLADRVAAQSDLLSRRAEGGPSFTLWRFDPANELERQSVMHAARQAAGANRGSFHVVFPNSIEVDPDSEELKAAFACCVRAAVNDALERAALLAEENEEHLAGLRKQLRLDFAVPDTATDIRALKEPTPDGPA